MERVALGRSTHHWFCEYHWAPSPVWYFIVLCSEYCVSDDTMRWELPLTVEFVGRGWNVVCEFITKIKTSIPRLVGTFSGIYHNALRSSHAGAALRWRHLIDGCNPLLHELALRAGERWVADGSVQRALITVAVVIVVSVEWLNN
jgi:hypothetical protein